VVPYPQNLPDLASESLWEGGMIMDFDEILERIVGICFIIIIVGGSILAVLYIISLFVVMIFFKT